MNENKAYGTGAETTVPPDISVKIQIPGDLGGNHGKLLAFASINLGGVFAVNNIRIFDTGKGPLVAMPSVKGRNGRYYDICCPTNREMRQAVNAAVLEAYRKETEGTCAEHQAAEQSAVQ